MCLVASILDVLQTIERVESRLVQTGLDDGVGRKERDGLHRFHKRQRS